ncbi:MAG TPA: hypothetical protein VLK34_07815 [Nocardioidaceae bacterium]|nr:hypothetical protein [Nocardioidaceae bacterium]
MIIRILAEGQFDVPDDTVDSLNELDGRLEAAVGSADEQAMASALGALLDRVREVGSELAIDSLTPSDLVLPHASATLAEVRDLLSGDGLIPG